MVLAVGGAGAAFLLWAGTRDVEASQRGWNWNLFARKSGSPSTGFSPAFGIFFMIAVTVVLATVLFVMVSSLGRGT